MPMKETRSTRKSGMETEAFKNLSKIQKIIYKKRTCIVHIMMGVKVARNTGFDKWERRTDSSQITKKIVQELITKN